MGGFFGVAAKDECIQDLFYGTDYHSHLGTKRGGMAVANGKGILRFIHNIENAQFRSKFEDDVQKMSGHKGVGVISDYEDQPLIIGSHLGVYAIVTVGVIKNAAELSRQAFSKRTTHFSEMSGDEINPTELVATLINQAGSFAEGIRGAQDLIEGSCSILLLTEEGLYAARDRLGRTPVVIGRRDGATVVTMETCALPNLGYQICKRLGPGEVALVNEDGVRTLVAPSQKMQICSFLWVYYGYPASDYEGINVEATRYRCGAALARADGKMPLDMVAGVPDSGTGHAIGYANESHHPYGRPFVKYTPTWPRSFMPQDQRVRDLVAKMKLIPIREMIEGKRLLFCEDSIVRGTQLKDTIQRLYQCGAKEVHMRPACPPLVYGCRFLNFSRSRSELDLAARRAIAEIGGAEKKLRGFANPDSDEHRTMVESIRQRLNLTTLRYQRLDDLVAAIGLPKEKLCTYCWDGCDGCSNSSARRNG